MASEYSKPMLDVGNPRVFNINFMTKKLRTKDAAAKPFFECTPLNRLVLIKDTGNSDDSYRSRSGIGTKLYFPFNEHNIYEGGRTIFFHDKHLQQALEESFGVGALKKEALDADLRLISVLDRLPSLDPFLLKDVFLNEGLTVNNDYFEVSEELWKEIEMFILQRFEPVVNAAFPDAMKSDEKARQLIEKIWEARDLEALEPLIAAFRLSKATALETFSSWKGINFYAFEYFKMKQPLTEFVVWMRDLQIPVGVVSPGERTEYKNMLEAIRNSIKKEWQNVETIFRNYQEAYDKAFKLKSSSGDFLTFLGNSAKLYWELGNSLGKLGHGIYCWNAISKRFPERKMPWEQLREVLMLEAKIFKPSGPSATTMKW